MKKNILSIAAIGATAILLGGCASTTENMISQGYGPSYAQGYDNGCVSGKNAAGSMFDQFTKNVNRYNRDVKYMQGWNDGFRTCKSQFEQIERNVRANARNQAIKSASK